VAPPTVRSSSSASVAAASGTVTKPSGAAVGDLLIGIQNANNDSTLASLTMTTPSGGTAWTVAGSSAGAASPGPGFLKIYWHVAVSADISATSYTFGGANSSMALAVLCVQGGTFDPTNPFAAAVTFSESNTAASLYPAPSVTGVVDGLLVCVFTTDDSGAGLTITPPSGMTELLEQDRVSTAETMLEVSTLALTSAGATGIKNATPSLTTRGYNDASLVIAPAPVSAAYRFMPFFM
jgi:hypothetical protein